MTAALGAIQAQLRADEHQLRRKTTGDVLERLCKLIEEEKKKLPKNLKVPLAPMQQPEHVELESSEGSVGG